MNVEIERKFLVKSEAWRGLAEGVRFRQGYLQTHPYTVRVRTEGERGVFHRKRLPYAGRFPGSGCRGTSRLPFRLGMRFDSRLRNKAKRCTDTDSVIVDAPLFPACPSGLVRPISMRILS